MSLAERLDALLAGPTAPEAIEVFVTDLNGLPRGKLIPARLAPKLAKGGMKMPVSALGLDIFSADVPESGNAIERGDPDGVMVPVAETLGPMLWAGRPTAMIACQLTEEDGSPCAYCPRSLLAAQVERLSALGLTATMAFELEFFLVDAARPLPAAPPGAIPLPKGRDQIYDLDHLRSFEPVLADLYSAADALGLPVETAICEFGPGQFEVNLGHVASPLTAADHMAMLRRAIRGTARAHGLDVTFMAKPFGEVSGSGMHVHVSLADSEGRRLFDAGDGDAPAASARHALAGLCASMADHMLIWAPHANSYRRFVPGSYAPLVAAWGLDNRGAALRMPETHGPGARIEHRIAGADANPYLVGAAILSGLIEGLEARAEPPPPCSAEAGEAEGTPLPRGWHAAERGFAESERVATGLGPGLQRVFSAMKRQERATLLARVSDVEYEAYLRTV